MIEREFKIRLEPAKLKHLDAMIEINKAAAPKWHQRRHLISALREKRAFVAFMGRIPAGFLVWSKDFYSHFFIDLVVIHPQMRRSGVATTLIKTMENFCAGNKLFTSTNRSNKKMQNVLKKSGYLKVGYITHLDRGDPEWIYYKKIPAKN